MQPAQARYGRPRGSGIDDRRELESIAALLAANPDLKPTTAIRSLGVEDPSTVRRLRDKFRHEQAALMAAARVPERPARRPGNENTPARESPEAPAPSLHVDSRADSARGSTTLAAEMFAAWCDVGFAALTCTVTAQLAVTQLWLGVPPVAAATRAQLAAGAMAIAVMKRQRGRKALH